LRKERPKKTVKEVETAKHTALVVIRLCLEAFLAIRTVALLSTCSALFYIALTFSRKYGLIKIP